MERKTLKCQDCHREFDFTKKQQKQFALNGWAAPIRCPSCRERKKEIIIEKEMWSLVNFFSNPKIKRNIIAEVC